MNPVEAIAAADREGEAEMAERTCIVTREVKDLAELIRFARAPSGEVVPDLRLKLPGRGVWVSCAASKVAEAARRKLFARGFRAECQVAPDLAERTAALGGWLTHYNFTRRHGSLGHKPPGARLAELEQRLE